MLRNKCIFRNRYIFQTNISLRIHLSPKIHSVIPKSTNTQIWLFVYETINVFDQYDLLLSLLKQTLLYYLLNKYIDVFCCFILTVLVVYLILSLLILYVAKICLNEILFIVRISSPHHLVLKLYIESIYKKNEKIYLCPNSSKK